MFYDLWDLIEDSFKDDSDSRTRCKVDYSDSAQRAKRKEEERCKKLFS